MTTGADRCKRYADTVIANPKLYPETIFLACKRFIKDLDRKDVYFDEKAANAGIANIEKLPHTKGRWQGKKIKLEDWQCFFVGNIFGWKWTKTKFRRFRYVYKQVPRKNGKSLIAIAVCLVLFGPDKEPGAEVYLGATTQGQADDLLFKPAQYIVKQCKPFAEKYGIEVNAQTLVIPANFSVLKSVIRKPDDGYNPHCAAVDEYHQHDTDEQYSTFDTGMGSREQPLLMVTTTAGSNLGGPCKEMHDDCLKILKGQFEDDAKFIMIYEPDEDDEWDSVETLRKVNPNIGVSVSEDYLLDQLNQARRSASKQNAFRTKHLNQWVGAKTAWMNMLAWQRQKKELSIEDFKGWECEMALDLASKKDLSALDITFKRDGKYYTFSKYYAPEAAIEENDKYQEFVNSGHLIATPGNMTDYDYILEDILQLCSDFTVRSIAYDPFQATYLVQKLMENGVTNLIEFKHTVLNMSEPMKQVEALVLDGKLFHDGNPCTTWQMGNVTAKLDVKENIYPNKERPNDHRCKIDGVVALIMAMGRWMSSDDTGPLKADQVVSFI